MFPTIRVSFLGHFDSSSRYSVVMDVVPVDCKRYRYAYHRSSWLAAGKADPAAPCRFYVHPDSPFTVTCDGPDMLGKLQSVSFEKLKLTNNVLDNAGRVSYHLLLLLLLFLFFFLLPFLLELPLRVFSTILASSFINKIAYMSLIQLSVKSSNGVFMITNV